MTSDGQFLNGLAPDAPIYRIEKVPHLLAELKASRLRLARPRTWEDPNEDLLYQMAVTYRGSEKWSQIPFQKCIPPVFAQCWSRTIESDPLWRAYSRVKRDAQGYNELPFEEGVQIKSTPRALLAALIRWAGANAERCFVGSVRYMSLESISQGITNETAQSGMSFFAQSRQRAEAALLKREAFDHEAEVRLIYVSTGEDAGTDPTIEIPVEPNEVINEIVFDGRLAEAERRMREASVRDLGYLGTVRRSELYQRVAYDVHLADPTPDDPCADKLSSPEENTAGRNR